MVQEQVGGLFHTYLANGTGEMKPGETSVSQFFKEICYYKLFFYSTTTRPNLLCWLSAKQISTIFIRRLPSHPSGLYTMMLMREGAAIRNELFLYIPFLPSNPPTLFRILY